VRALTRPYPGAYTVHDGRRVTIWDAVAFESPGAFEAFEPGRLVHRYGSGELAIRCGDSALIVRDHDLPAGLDEAIVFESADHLAQLGAIRDRHLARYPDLPLADWPFAEGGPAEPAD
jgi:hypothetical protein